MQLVRFKAEDAQPLAGGDRVTYVPVQTGGRLTAMLLHLERDGDTGKRELDTDALLIVIAGQGRVRSGGQIADIEPGDVCVLTGGMLHHIWTNDSELRAVLMAVG